MAQNQVYLIKSGENSFVEETQAIVGISGGKVGIGTTHPEADLHVTGSVKVGGDLTVDGTLTTINSSTVSVDDINIELGSTDNPTDTTAEGGGITVKGTTNKTFNWYVNGGWTSSENLSVADGKHFAGDELRALNAGGLNLFDANQSGITIKDGKVGVHKTAPAYDLDVDGSGNFTSLYVGGNSVLTGEGSIFGKWEDGATAGEIFYTGGNVGVGTINPEHDLHVVGNGVVDGNFVVNGTSGTFNVGEFDVSGSNITLNSAGGGLDSSRGGLIVNGDNETGKLEYLDSSQAWQSNQNIQIVADKHLQTDKVRAIDTGGLYLQDDGGNGIFIEDGGQVGVNTSSPNYSLDVNGSAKIGSDFYAGTAFKISAGGAVGDIAPASDGDIIKWDDSSDKWVAGANVGGGGGGGVGEVPLATIESLASGQSIYQIDFAETYNVEPRIATQLEIDGEGSIIPYVVSGVSTSGYHLIFAQDVPNNNYRIHTTFGGRDVHWETGASASLYYNDGDVSLQRNLTVGGNLTVNGTQTIVNTETLEIKDHNLVIAANTGHDQLTNEYPGIGDAYAGILWGTGDAGVASPVSLTYQSNKGFAFEGGNVGIGTTNPSGKLEIKRGKNGFPNPTISEDDVTALRVIGNDNAVLDMGVNGGFGTWIQSRNKLNDSIYDLLLNPNGGNVGIGTTNPTKILSVQGEVSGGISLSSFSNAASNADSIAGIDFQSDEGEGVRPRARISSGADGSNSGYLTLHTRSAGSIKEAMTIDSEGNVGIGTTNPNRKLQIHSDTAVAQIFGVTTLLNSIAISHASIGHGADKIGNLQLGNASGNLKVYLKSDGDSYFTGGNVGIGTTNPSGKLSVEGSEVQTNLAAGNSQASIKIRNTSKTDGNFGCLDFYNAHNFITARVGAHFKDNSDEEVQGRSTELYFATRKTESALSTKMIIDEDGNVGIGTTSPGTKLDIVGNSAAVKVSESSGAEVRMAAGGSTGYIGTYSNHDLAILTNSSDAMRIDSEGNVGIGTTNPGKPLHIAANAHHFILEDTNAAAGEKMRGIFNNSNNLNFARYTDDFSDAFTDLIIDEGGNVGIGTTIPGAKLTTLIEDDSTYGNSSPNIANCVLSLKNTPTSEAVNNHATLQFNLNAVEHNHVGSISLISESATLRRGALAFCVDDGSASRPEAMRIHSSGNVGIGTTNPGAKLDIFGEKTAGDLVKIKISPSESGNPAGLHITNTNTNLTELSAYFKITDENGNHKFRINKNGHVGIGTATPTAALEVTSTTGGVIMPRMTTVQRNAISDPADGEMVYDIDLNKFYGHADGAWVALH